MNIIMTIILNNSLSDGKIAYLIKSILMIYNKSEVNYKKLRSKNRISDLDNRIAEFVEVVKTFKSTGNNYKEFNFKFNFVIKNLLFLKYLKYIEGNLTTILIDKGLNIDVENLNVDKNIMILSRSFGMN